MKTISKETIDKIKSLGFRVFMRPNSYSKKLENTYLYFSDGKNIGYYQEGIDGPTLSTVHVPCRAVGTGFRIGEIREITKDALQSAFYVAPEWISDRDRSKARKYPSLEAFLKSPEYSWGGGLQEV